MPIWLSLLWGKMANMRRACEPPETYVTQLTSKLSQLETTYVEVLAATWGPVEAREAPQPSAAGAP